MIRKTVLSVVVLACVVCLVSSVAIAASFEPLFKINKITGKCFVVPPATEKPVAAEEGKAYPYGTKVQTGRKSSLVIEFSKGNECRVLANADLTVTEDVKDKKLKTVKLNGGKIEVTLEKAFKENNGLNVETPSAICGAIGCRFDVHATEQRTVSVVVIICHDGEVTAYGADFKIPIMSGGSSVSVSRSQDGSLTRLRNVQGQFKVSIKDAEGNPKDVNTTAGSVLKIWRKPKIEEKKVIVTIMVTSPTGELLESITYERTLGTEIGDDKILQRIEGIIPGQPVTDWTIITTTTTTTTAPTTSTTVPITTTTVVSPTPVGKR